MARIEVVRFTLRSGVTEVDFGPVNDRFQEDVAYQSAGILRRTVATSDDGSWIDVRLWRDDSPCAEQGNDEVRSQWGSMVEILSRDLYTTL